MTTLPHVPDHSLSGKLALVTGASSGIGAATAQRLAELGATVVIHYRSGADRAEAVASRLPGSGHRTLQADLSAPTCAESMIQSVVDDHGRLDVLVNNAGVFTPHPPMQASWDEWQREWTRTLDVNLLAPAHLCYFAARAMAAAGGGHIVNVSSRGAFRGEPNAPAYGASKAGLNAMSQSLAVALAPENVFVYVVAPGFVDTPMVTDFLAGERGEQVRNQSPLGRVGTPEEVANIVAFLACPGSEFMTGAIVDINGASYLRT